MTMLDGKRPGDLNMRKYSQRAFRYMVLFLVTLTAAGAIVSGSVIAKAEADAEQRNHSYTIDMHYLPDEQALRISQRLVYINKSDDPISSILFYASGNMFRRERALMYEADDLEKVFPLGFAPGGIDIQSVRFGGQETSWGMQGTEEMYIRVDCEINPGESGIFEFDYYLLLNQCNAFLGVGETDIRLSAFYFIPGIYNDAYDEFMVNAALPFTRWLESDSGDYDVTLTVPDNYDVAATGMEMLLKSANHLATWNIKAENAREFAVSFGKRYRKSTYETATGGEIRVFSNVRNDAVLECAIEAVRICEEWFGKYPVEQLDIVQSDYPLGALNYPGVIWLSSSLFDAQNKDEMEKRVRFCVAQQYFGLDSYTSPVSDAWLSDALCEYISYMILEESKGYNAFVKAINEDWVDALQLTIPGGLMVTSDAGLFTSYEYEVVVLCRGAVVMHEMRNAVGRENMLLALRYFYEMGADGHTLTEMELVEAFDAVTGGSWEKFLTDWAFNVGDYVDQTIVWFE